VRKGGVENLSLQHQGGVEANSLCDSISNCVFHFTAEFSQSGSLDSSFRTVFPYLLFALCTLRTL
jgi:hypothetical protein